MGACKTHCTALLCAESGRHGPTQRSVFWEYRHTFMHMTGHRHGNAQFNRTMSDCMGRIDIKAALCITEIILKSNCILYMPLAVYSVSLFYIFVGSQTWVMVRVRLKDISVFMCVCWCVCVCVCASVSPHPHTQKMKPKHVFKLYLISQRLVSSWDKLL